MNFIEYFEQGKKGDNVGSDTGIPKLTVAIRGVQKKMIYAVAAGPKVGKSKLVNFVFILAPYLQAIKDGTLDLIEWIFYSFEMDRVTTEFNFAAFFFAHDYNIYSFKYNDNTYGMCADYLMGKLLDKNTGERIPVSDEHFQLLKEIYKNRIIPLFGQWGADGKQITKGKIQFIEERDNPTGLRNYVMSYAKQNGEFLYETYYTEENGKRVSRKRISGYKEKNPKKKTIIITDHMRKLKSERGFQMKQNVDKWVEYQVELRNWCKFTFVDIIHINRNISAVERLKFAGEWIYPTGDDLKDTGNLSEDANTVITMFNPNDEKYGLEKHMELELENYPNYRSIHIVESRETECPLHIQVNMFGGVNMFLQI